jgi:four helix bundle protein
MSRELLLNVKPKNMRNFKELKIWQKGFEIAVDTYKLIGGFPKSERFSLAQQATRAAISIPSNIAEGSSRRSEKDYYRFIEISLGSSFELETQLLIAKAVKFGDENLINNTLSKVDEEQKMLMAFANKLSS